MVRGVAAQRPEALVHRPSLIHGCVAVTVRKTMDFGDDLLVNGTYAVGDVVDPNDDLSVQPVGDVMEGMVCIWPCCLDA